MIRDTVHDECLDAQETAQALLKSLNDALVMLRRAEHAAQSMIGPLTSSAVRRAGVAVRDVIDEIGRAA